MIAPGPDGNMWFTENANPGALARISLPPLVRTRPIEHVSESSAVLEAKIRPNAQATEFRLEYGSGESLKLESEASTVAAGWAPVYVSMRITGLKPEKEYRFRVVATNDSGTSVGDVEPLTTASLAPEHGKLVVAEPTGRVRFKRPGDRWRPLPAFGAELPVGVALDMRRGEIRLTTEDRSAETQSGRFGGGVVQVRQPRRAKGRVDLHLRGGNFGPAGSSRRARSRQPRERLEDPRVRRLWGRDRGGSFRTYGRHSHATVRGTRWLTVDRCDGTLTRVTGGAVVVRDLARHRRVVVRAGHSYLAHDARPPPASGAEA